MSEASCETQAYSPHLKKVLNSYRTAAMTSLSGPNSCLGSWPASSKLMDYDHHHHHHHPHGLKTKTLHQVLSSVKKNCAHTSTTTTAATTTSTSQQPSQTATSQTVQAVQAVQAAPAQGTRGSADYDPFLAPPPFPIQQLPILTAPDQSRSERSETVLEGEVISCFVVGGEKRLCLPQILNSVLRDFSLQQINAVCDDLQIFCSRCNREQLEVLKVTGVLPFAAPSCGLITKTDAERLCSALLYRHPVVLAGSEKKKYSLKVYHECFGKCKGLYTPDDYSSPSALCIECLECHGHFSPQKFVCHAHKALEKRTCHWGFDSANWRAYVLVAKEQANLEQLQSKLDEMKNRYYDDYHGKYKRKQYTQEEKDLSKKAKYGPEESPVNAGYLPYVYDPMSAYWYPTIASQWSRVSAFRPWSPVVGKDGKPTLNQPMPQQAAFFRDNISQSLPSFLSHGPPVLLNPERVVPLSETERFERHYQPNVALAPPSAQQVPQKTCLSSTANVLMGNSPREKRIIPDDNNDVKIMNPEIDMSTDTDETLSDSTISAESNDYQCEAVGSGNEKNTSEDNKVDEIESLRKLMEANNIGAEPQQEIVKEVEKLRKKYKTEAELAIKEKDALQREIDYLRMSKREKLREASEAKRHLRKQLQQVHEEHSAQLMEQMQVQEQLRSQLAAALSIKQETPEKIGRGKKIVEQVSPVEDIAAAEGKLMNEPSIKVEKERD